MAQKKHTRVKVAVIGSGFVGDVIARRLAKDSRYDAVAVPKGINPLRSVAFTKFLMAAKPQCVINAWSDTGGIGYVGLHQADIIRNNANAVLNIYEASRAVGVRQVVNCISNSTYPASEKKLLTESDWWSGPPHPSVISIAASGKHIWAISSAYQAQYGIESANLVIGSAYGPEDSFDEARSYALQALLVKIVRAKWNKEKSVIVFGTGAPVRDWLYGDDCAEAVLSAIGAKTGIDPINIGSGTGISIRDLAVTLQTIVGYKGTLVFDATRPDGAPYKVMDIRRAAKVLKWKPRTALSAGLKKTVAWYLKNKP